MARISYGPEVKKRSQQLLAALLNYANDELDCDPTALDTLRPNIQVHWQTEQRLVIRTKVRFLESLAKLAGTPLSGEQIKEALRRFEDFLGLLEDNRPNRGGSETWHFTLNLWHQRHETLPIAGGYQTANLCRFEQEWEQRRPQQAKKLTQEEMAKESVKSAGEGRQDVWWQLCRESLEAQQYQRLTINPLLMTEGWAFDLQGLYIPLGLMERKRQARWDIDISPDQGSQLYGPEDLDTDSILSVGEFLDRLLTSASRQRLAIVGEPGAGKTTLLQKVATWLLDQQVLPIWISLADLQTATLETYLLVDWLKQATRRVIVPPELQEELAEQFRQGRVWLLLDAIDEMATDASTALAAIARQLRGWIADAHIILTCRSNVWDGGKNALDSFVTYCNLSFNYGDASSTDQVRQFIEHWFQSQPELSDRLRLELDKPERKRIKDTVKNPLRLALLCRSWSLTQGTLPSTKATLYQQFVETIYEWKQDRFPTTPAQRQQLNQVLGNLALAALSQPEMRFRLPYSFVKNAFQPALELLPLALQLGWLNQVGISTTSGEKVYAFYHPTFQEYFAAQAIASWQFFCNPTPDLPIFRPHWREVILLWLGRPEITTADKESFIQTLIEFEDGCGGFYAHRAYFLAAAGLAEFPQARQATAMLARLLEWRFGCATAAQPRRTYPVPLCEGARVALLQTDRTLAIIALEQLLQVTSDPFAKWNAAYTLGKTLDPGNLNAIATLTELIQTLRHEILRLQISESLGKVDPGNLSAIQTLMDILASTQLETIRRKAAYSLGKIDPGNAQAIATLETLITTTTSRHLQLQAAKNLAVLAPENTVAIAVLQANGKQTRRSNRRSQVSGDQDRYRVKTMTTLEQRLTTAQDISNQRRLAYRLAMLQPGHPQAVDCLLQLLLIKDPAVPYKRIVENLKEVLLNEQLLEVVTRLRRYRLTLEEMSEPNQEVNSTQAHECYKLLWHCAQQMTYHSFLSAWEL